MTGHQSTGRLLDVLREPLAATGLDVEAVEMSTVGRRSVVRVLVDKDGGVSLDDLAAATTLVGDRLDDSDAVGDRPYTLEVTSPGVDRPLTAPRHWRRNVDRLVALTTTSGRQIEGRIIGADDAAATLAVDGATRTIEYDEISTARIQVEFNRRPREEG